MPLALRSVIVGFMVLAKRTSKNQLTLPKVLVEAAGPADLKLS